jgi:hypothetical protein
VVEILSNDQNTGSPYGIRDITANKKHLARAESLGHPSPIQSPDSSRRLPNGGMTVVGGQEINIKKIFSPQMRHEHKIMTIGEEGRLPTGEPESAKRRKGNMHLKPEPDSK